MVGQVLLLLKIFVYYSAHFTVQTGIIFDECRENIVDKSQVMAWLSYEVVAFYLNILAMCVFLLLSSCKKFVSIRERIGFSSQLRKTTDFLTYCKEDIHWFCMWFTQIMLCILALTMKVKSHEDLKWSVGLLFTRHILELVVLRQVYFNSKFEIKSYIKLIMAIIFVLNCFMIKLFFDLEDDHSTWWAPIMLHDIILHFYVFFQIAMESSQWEKLKAEYAAQGGDQESNAKLLAEAKDSKINVSSGPDSAGQDSSIKPLKVLKLGANIYTISYCAFMKANKNTYKLKSNDQMDIFYRALFMGVMQFTFIVTLLMNETFDLTYKNDTAVNFCQFFCVMILHW